jgi:acetyl-CoA acetyltransferase
VSRGDIDLAEWSDPTAMSTILALEDYDFCERGAGGAFVGSGDAIKVNGSLPVNTNGWLSGSFACASHGTLVEAVRQLQGTCGPRQVPGAELAFHAAIGGVQSAHSVTILSSS